MASWRGQRAPLVQSGRVGVPACPAPSSRPLCPGSCSGSRERPHGEEDVPCGSHYSCFKMQILLTFGFGEADRSGDDVGCKGGL